MSEEKEDIIAGEMNRPKPPEGQHLWVIIAAFEVKPEKIAEAMEQGPNSEGFRELNMKADVLGIVTASPPECLVCGEAAVDCHDIPCVGARGRRREKDG